MKQQEFSRHLAEKWSSLSKERLRLIGTAILIVIMAVWTFTNDTKPRDENRELSLSIPPGEVVIPLELSNAPSLASLVNQTAIIDVYKIGEEKPLIKNLRIIKLLAGEGPIFGALVPEAQAGRLQTLDSKAKLRGALASPTGAPTTFLMAPPKIRKQITEIEVGDAL